ncbi:hypothetical protein AB6A40_010371 [Gnathostoma spinigerum]|uniref:Uncharacterized protein n=1 Tax=Gnathostoma spinigerum TaxID=75299 RepID=A0ABD6F2L8_9BILA
MVKAASLNKEPSDVGGTEVPDSSEEGVDISKIDDSRDPDVIFDEILSAIENGDESISVRPVVNSTTQIKSKPSVAKPPPIISFEEFIDRSKPSILGPFSTLSDNDTIKFAEEVDLPEEEFIVKTMGTNGPSSVGGTASEAEITETTTTLPRSTSVEENSPAFSTTESTKQISVPVTPRTVTTSKGGNGVSAPLTITLNTIILSIVLALIIA